MLKRIFGLLVVTGILAGVSLAQTPSMAPPDALPADATVEQVQAEVLAVHGILCEGVHHAMEILSSTGKLAEAMPVVVELTGLQAAEMQAFEVEVCRGDVSELPLEELRAVNRQAAWLLDVHMVALSKVLIEN